MKLNLPPMKCDKDCGDCCGIAPCNEAEFKAIGEYIKKNRVVPQNNGLTCPFYQKGTCQIYPVRPVICQLFGHVPNMICSKGYNVNVTPEKIAAIHKQYDFSMDRTTHDFLTHEE
jgi:Fe-S-cluster containining protein